jgi:hypothetical protein
MRVRYPRINEGGQLLSKRYNILSLMYSYLLSLSFGLHFFILSGLTLVSFLGVQLGTKPCARCTTHCSYSGTSFPYPPNSDLTACFVDGERIKGEWCMQGMHHQP